MVCNAATTSLDMGERPPRPECRILPPEICDRLSNRAGIGGTGLIEMLPGGDRVRKTVHPLETCPRERILMRQQIQREFEVYQRLGPHPRFIRMLGLDTACDGEQGIILEYMPKGDLHEFLRSDVDISMERRLQWCVEAATAVVFLHSLGIIHADIRPQNMLLDQNLGLRLIDLAGASIDGKDPLSLESTRFFFPRDCRDRAVVSVTTDLFALGSSFYETVTRKLPYPELKSDEVEARYARQEFPQVEDVALGDIIRGCWMGDFTSAAAVLNAIELEIPKHKLTEAEQIAAALLSS